jgi:hypothetical protein
VKVLIRYTFDTDCQLWDDALSLNFRTSVASALGVNIASISDATVACGSTIVTAFLLTPSAALSNLDSVQTALNSITFCQQSSDPLCNYNTVGNVVLDIVTPSPTSTPTSSTVRPSSAPTAKADFTTSGLFIALVVIGCIIVLGIIILIACCLCTCCLCYPDRELAKEEAQRRLENTNKPINFEKNAMVVEMGQNDIPLDQRPLPPGWKKCYVESEDGSPAYVGAPYYFHEWKGWSEWDLEAVFAHPIEAGPTVGPPPPLSTEEAGKGQEQGPILSSNGTQPTVDTLAVPASSYQPVRRMSKPPEHPMPKRLSIKPGTSNQGEAPSGSPATSSPQPYEYQPGYVPDFNSLPSPTIQSPVRDFNALPESTSQQPVADSNTSQPVANSNPSPTSVPNFDSLPSPRETYTQPGEQPPALNAPPELFEPVPESLPVLFDLPAASASPAPQLGAEYVVVDIAPPALQQENQEAQQAQPQPRPKSDSVLASPPTESPLAAPPVLDMSYNVETAPELEIPALDFNLAIPSLDSPNDGMY